jgi:cell wall assembly regulator SMI1
MFISQPNEREPVPVADSWKRLEKWLAANVPEITLQPGCSDTELGFFEKEFGVTLPDDVKQSFRLHNGQSCDIYPGAIAGEWLDPIERVRDSLSIWRSLYEEEQESDSGFGERATSFPPDAIRCEYATPGWIPLLNTQDGNNCGVDLNPGPSGVYGQVINFGRDEDDKYVLGLVGRISWRT